MTDDPTVETGKSRGAMVWRGVRYLSCVGAGYFLGLAAGVSTPEGPPVWLVAILGLVALVLVFRKGQQSNSHAAVDAVLQSRAQAAAVARATQQVNIAGGHIVGGQDGYPLPGNVAHSVTPAQAPYGHLPPVEVYEDDVWDGRRASVRRDETIYVEDGDPR